MKRTIFDIGMHRGLDANYYARKGFNVVGVEAVPALYEIAMALNAEFAESGQLVGHQRALHEQSGITVPFFVHPSKDDWGSLTQKVAERGKVRAQEIAVQTLTLDDLLKQHGVPYYIKCDIEGGDRIFVEQLLATPEKPAFVSIELQRAEDLAVLAACKYDRFQIVNQYNHPFMAKPKSTREGQLVDTPISHVMSGPFGLDLAWKKWRSFAETMRAFQAWLEFERIFPGAQVGWIDVHATCLATLVET